MHFTREQRDSWAASTRDSPFNRWLKERVSDGSGGLDLAALHALAAVYGIDAHRYAHLNPGQQRMNIGNRLRKLMPSVLDADGEGTPIGRRPLTLHRPIAPVSTEPVVNADPSRKVFVGVSDREIIQLYGAVIDELRARDVIRTGNAPLGDYAEYIFSKAFRWSLEGNSASGHDAIDQSGVRYQVKARRLRCNSSGERQLSVIRGLPDAKFDTLAAVLFDKNFDVHRAALIPHSVVLARSTYIAHVNGWRLMLDDNMWSIPGVQDVTLHLRSAAAASDSPSVKTAMVDFKTAANDPGAFGWVSSVLEWMRTR